MKIKETKEIFNNLNIFKNFLCQGPMTDVIGDNIGNLDVISVMMFLDENNVPEYFAIINPKLTQYQITTRVKIEDTEVYIYDIYSACLNKVLKYSYQDMCNTKYRVGKFPVQKGKKSLEFEEVENFLDGLSKKKEELKLFKNLELMYQILNNYQYLDISFEDSIKYFQNQTNIDLSNFQKGISSIDKEKKRATEDNEKLNYVYNLFLESINLFYGDIDNIKSKILLKRPELSGMKILKDLNYMSEDDSILYTNSELFQKFVEKVNLKYPDGLKDIPGFYQKFHLKDQKWNWKMTPINGIIIPNKVNDKIVNLQIRTNYDDGKNRYINFSSSKKVGQFYRYATKARAGLHYICNDKKNDAIVVTEGFFKAVTMNENPDILREIIKDKRNCSLGDFDVLSNPGLNIKQEALDIIAKYDIAYLLFDKDVSNGQNKEAARQFIKLVEAIERLGIKVIVVMPDNKIDDDIFKIKNG